MKRKQYKSYTVSQANAILAHNIKLEINTMLMVSVLAVDVANQTVDVQPVIKSVVKDDNSSKIFTTIIGEDINVSDVTMPAIMGVPICYQRAGTAMITLPIQIGDTGMLICSQRDISLWKVNGGIAEQVENRMFDINDGVFLPFVANKTNKISDYSNSALEIRFGSDKISMDGEGKINVTVGDDMYINGIGFLHHIHPQGNDSGTNTEQDTGVAQ